MKKILAIALSLIMSCSILAGCGSSDSDSNSKADEASYSQQEEGSLAQTYTDKINAGEFVAEISSSSGGTNEFDMTYRAKSGNYHATVTVYNIQQELYIVDGKGYLIIPLVEAYQEMDDATVDTIGADLCPIPDGYALSDTNDEDGSTVEVYKPTNDASSSSEDSTDSESSADSTDDEGYYYSYYFDSSSKEIQKVVISQNDSEVSTLEFNSIKYECEDIALPDMDALSLYDSENPLDDVSQIKLSLAMYGVDEDMLKEAGYTYETFTALTNEEQMTALSDMGISLS